MIILEAVSWSAKVNWAIAHYDIASKALDRPWPSLIRGLPSGTKSSSGNRCSLCPAPVCERFSKLFDGGRWTIHNGRMLICLLGISSTCKMHCIAFTTSAISTQGTLSSDVETFIFKCAPASSTRIGTTLRIVKRFGWLNSCSPFSSVDSSLVGQWACVAESSNRGGSTRRATTNQPHKHKEGTEKSELEKEKEGKEEKKSWETF